MRPELKLFGDTIRIRRQQLGLSQEALADLVGLHRTYIGGIERGERNVSLLNILRLAKSLDCRPSDLFKKYEQEI
jgi:transcriptional regulator with XRE-family HTH domain